MDTSFSKESGGEPMKGLATTTATESPQVNRTAGASSPLASKSNSTSTSPTSNGKLKTLQQQQTQQQQQQQQQPNHQFRTPQQFVKQRKSTNSALSKKNKPWNKRQHKIGKQQQHQLNIHTPTTTTKSTIATTNPTATDVNVNATLLVGSNAISVANDSTISSKADLENIQNVKYINNGPGSGSVGMVGIGVGVGVGAIAGSGGGYHAHHSHHHHSHTHHSHYGGAGHRLTGNSNAITGSLTANCSIECRSLSGAVGGGGGGNNVSGNIGSTGINLHAPASLEKLCYSHGHHHLKQQLYKKVIAHRGHYHNHVLCAGAAHNSHGSNGPNSGVCCILHGCPTQNGGKDKDGNNSHNSSNSSVASAAACNSLNYCCGRAKFFLPDKRLRKEIIVPPTKFLLGGNISDPLNLNSLQNETASNNNTPATTPRRSPITTPPKVEVIIPPNIHDPLHLLDPVDSMEYEKQLTSPLKRHPRGHLLLNKPYKPGRNRKNRKPKRRRHDSYSSLESAVIPHQQHDTSGSQSATETLSISADAITGSVSLLSASTGTVALTDNSNAEERQTSGVETECTKWNTLPMETQQSADSSVTAGTVTQSQQPDAHAGEQHGTVVLSTTATEHTGPMTRERASRELRLELNSTSTTNSTCGSITGLSSLSGRSTSGRGRKRKISESNNSLKNKKHRESLDKIVSPVVPQPGAWKRPPRQAASGARKQLRRSTSVSESEVLSPAEEIVRLWPTDGEGHGVITSDNSKLDSMSETGLGSPLSTISGSTSIATADQDAITAEANVENASGNIEAPVQAPSIPGASDKPNTSKTLTVATATVTETAKTTTTTTIPTKTNKSQKFNDDGQKFRFGNYDRYKGVRQLNEFIDVRLHVFSRNSELFQNKDILDIGCNTGQMTISVARDLAPKSILGIDIDKDLIKRARRNLAMFVRIPRAIMPANITDPIERSIKKEKEEPKSVDGSGGDGNATGAAHKKRRNRKGKKQRLAAAARAAAMQPATAAHLMHHHHLLHHHHHHYFHHLNNNWHPEQPHHPRLHVNANELFPISFPLSYGSLDKFHSVLAPPLTHYNDAKSPASRSTPGHPANNPSAGTPNDFPRNVYFRQLNYVPKEETQLGNDTQQYDLILCLSVTKWIHLNFGDTGLKMAFKRMFNQLRPGGKLILEAQNWASYKKKSNLTEEIHKNYQTIEFFPNKFHEYLLSSEVGFSHSYTLGVPRHLNKGFGRPIQLYAKGDYTPNHVRWSDAYYPTTPFEEYRGIYAFIPPRSSTYGWNYAKSSTRSQNYDTPHHVSGGTSGPYSCRQTPVYHPTYNPLETDSYQPSYDMEYLNHVDVFGSPGSPLYQTVWSPPASLRNSSSHTPVYGSVREAELDGEGGGGSGHRRHVYPPNDDTFSPNANAGGAFNSIRDPDTDDSAGNVRHVYATNCGESSSSPQVLRPETEMIDESLMLDDDAVSGSGGAGFVNEP